jgi:hypothetical protein
MKLLAKEATITTATVEVKSLTITGKQVTLSVFRQLLNEPLVDEETAELRGVPWGTVNYFWGDCKPDHLHVVWQKGDELRRACVYKPRWPYLYAKETEDDDTDDPHVPSIMFDVTSAVEDRIKDWVALRLLEGAVITLKFNGERDGLTRYIPAPIMVAGHRYRPVWYDRPP